MIDNLDVLLTIVAIALALAIAIVVRYRRKRLPPHVYRFYGQHHDSKK